MSNGGKKKDSPRQAKPSSVDPAEGPSLPIRVVLSFVLVFHVIVVFLYPWHNSRTSFTVNDVAQSPLLRWYADPLYLNHGHGFFGPEPPPGFIIEYQVFDDDGQVKAEGKFPDAQTIWPRLRYHRFKMLADQIEAPGRPRKEDRLAAYARQLIRQHDGERATVVEVIHDVVSHAEWLGDESQGIEPKAIDDKSLYRTLLTITQTRADVEAADAAMDQPEELPNSEQAEPIAIPVPTGVLP